MNTEQHIQNLMADKKYCYAEITEARKVFTNSKSTKKQWEAMEASLAFMYLHCPKELSNAVLSTLDESERRKPIEFIIGG